MMSSISEKILQAQTVAGVPPQSATFSFDSIASTLHNHRAQHSSKTFLIYYDENNNRVEYSFSAFCSLVAKTAAWLASQGIGKGSRIATAAHNHPDTVIQYFAAWTLQACVVPLNMSEDDSRLAFIIENSGCSLVLSRPDYLSRINSVTESKSCNVIPIDEAYHQEILKCDELKLECVGCLDAECLIVYTSGTTGNPKGVVLVQRNLFADADGIASWHGIDHTQLMMCVLPIHHVNGTIVTLVTPFVAGASVVLNRKFQTEHFFERIARESVTVVSVVPTLLAYLLEAKADDCNAVAYGFRHIICGAGPLTCELARRFYESYGIRIVHGYGLSETTCYSCFMEADLGDDNYKYWMQDFGFPSIGTPIPQNEMQIHDANGNALEERERGEIVIRGHTVMKEYFNNQQANEETFRYGWFRSGDEGFFVRAEGGEPYFFITGRIKELFIRGGVNLAPLEIDEVINSAPGVRAGISVGFENDFYGEEVGALVIPKSGADSELILNYCYSKLPFSKAPKVVLFCESLPVTATGKYQRNKVKHLFEEWKGVQFRKS